MNSLILRFFGKKNEWRRISKELWEAGYEPFSPDDEIEKMDRMTAENHQCPTCKHIGAEYKPFTLLEPSSLLKEPDVFEISSNRADYRAFMVCKKCGRVIEI